MSGSSSSTCASRSMPLTRSVPSAKPDGSSGSRYRSPPMPAVVLITMSTSLARIRSHDLAVQRHVPGAGAGARVPHVHVHDGRPGPGRLDRRTRRSAPGVTGTCSDLPTVSPAPVSAQVMMTLRFTAGPLRRVDEPRAMRRSRRGRGSSGHGTGGRASGSAKAQFEVLTTTTRAGAVEVDELAAAAVGADPVAARVQRPPVVAEADVRAQRAGQPAGAQERQRRARTTRATQAGSSSRVPSGAGAVDLQQPDPGPVPGGCGQPAAGQRHPVAVDRDRGVGGAAQSRHSSATAGRTGHRWPARAPSQAPASRPCSTRSGCPAGSAAPTRASTARERRCPRPNAATSALAGPAGSRWSSTQSTPLVMVSSVPHRDRARSRCRPAPARARDPVAQPQRTGPHRAPRPGGPARTWSPTRRGTASAGPQPVARTTRAPARRRPAPAATCSRSRVELGQAPAPARPRRCPTSGRSGGSATGSGRGSLAGTGW